MTTELQSAMKAAERWPWALKGLRRIAAKGDSQHFQDVMSPLVEELRKHGSWIAADGGVVAEAATRTGTMQGDGVAGYGSASLAVLLISQGLSRVVWLERDWPERREAVNDWFAHKCPDDKTLTQLSVCVEMERVEVSCRLDGNRFPDETETSA